MPVEMKPAGHHLVGNNLISMDEGFVHFNSAVYPHTEYDTLEELEAVHAQRFPELHTKYLIDTGQDQKLAAHDPEAYRLWVLEFGSEERIKQEFPKDWAIMFGEGISEEGQENEV